MKKLFYPAVFHKAEEGGFWVSFPDIPECLTEGDTTEQAYEMASDALGLALVDRLKNNEKLPTVSEANNNVITDSNSVLMLVEFDMEKYLKKNSNKAVKKTLSIPEWMNEEAIAMNINFSQVLQEALMAKLAVK